MAEEKFYVLPAMTPTPSIAGVPYAKVSLTKFDEITQDAYMKAVTSLIDALGRDRWKNMVYGKRVLLKPNWAWPALADPKRLQAEHTNPYLLRALAVEARDAGARRVILAESPAGGTYTQGYDRLYINATAKENLGGGLIPLKELPEELNFLEKGDYNWDKARWVDVINPYSMPKVVQPELFSGSDVVLISVPVLKPHHSARVTLGLKNVGIGCLPSTSYAALSPTQKNPKLVVRTANEYMDRENAYHDFCKTAPVTEWISNARPLSTKLRGHAWAAAGFAERNPEIPQITHTYKDGRVKNSVILYNDSAIYVGAQIADVCQVNPISMTVIDASVTREGGNIPLDIKPRIGSYFLIGGYDPVAVDAFATKMMGWPVPLDLWTSIPTLHFCEQKGMGIKDLNSIEVLYEGKNYKAISPMLPMLGFSFIAQHTFQSEDDTDHIWSQLNNLDVMGLPSIPLGLEIV